MWELLLLALGLGAALGTPGPGDPCACHNPRRGHAVANATLGATVTLGCPMARAQLGRLVKTEWHFRGDPAVPAVPVCALKRGPPRCHPPYGDRVTLVAPDVPPGSLVLRDVRGGDNGTFTCQLFGDLECACGTVTLRLRAAGIPQGPEPSPGCHPLSPRRWRDPSVSPEVTLAVSPLPPRQCHPVGDKPVPPQQPGVAQSLPALCPQQWQCHVPGPCPLPGDSAGTRGQQDTGTGGHGAAAQRLLKAGMPAAGGLLCGVSGLALLVAATATHFWVQRRAPGGTASLGLWHGCLGGQCHPHVTTPALLEAARVLLLLSVVAAAAGLALGVSVGTGGGRRARTRVTGATLLLAALLALLGLGLCSGGALALPGSLRSSWSFSWSFILGWVGAALLGSAGLFHLCAASKDPSPESSEVGGS